MTTEEVAEKFAEIFRRIPVGDVTHIVTTCPLPKGRVARYFDEIDEAAKDAALYGNVYWVGPGFIDHMRRKKKANG